MGDDGYPVGAWTPQLPADAISDFEANKKGIDLRSVQHWFEDNGKGPGRENINWLTRVFGCDDADKATQWRTELSASYRRMALKRRPATEAVEEHPIETPKHPGADSDVEATGTPSNEKATGKKTAVGAGQHRPKTLAEKCEWVLSGSATLNLLIAYWLVITGLALLNFVVNAFSVTYMPYEGLNKQVGFIWAPTLTVLPVIALPLFIYYVSELNTYWKTVGRALCVSQGAFMVDVGSNAAWYAKVNDFKFSFWAIALFCSLFVFGFQWTGIYLPAYLSGDAGGVQIDRYLVALVRPEIISISEAMVLSFVGYIYSASYIAVFMFGLLFFVIVVLDFFDLCSTSRIEGGNVEHDQIRRVGQKIIWGGFRVAVFALWLAILIKLQIAYLSSDSANFLMWIAVDFQSALNMTDVRNGLLENTSVNHFTTFMMMIVTVTVFIYGIVKVQGAFDRLSVYGKQELSTRERLAIFEMIEVIALLSLSLVLAGRFTGFLIVLGISAIASLFVLSGPKLRTD